MAFGPARNGFGLFLPVFRVELGLSTTESGVIAGGAYVGYLAALSIVGLVADRVDARTLLTIGGLTATTGLALVAAASDVVVLAVGLVLAASYAGWSWAPYNDAVEEEVPSSFRDRVLSAVSTGTSFGLVGSGLVALAVLVWGLSWRVAWASFATAALVVTVWNAKALPVDEHHMGSGPPPGEDAARWARPGSVGLFVAAFTTGILSGFHYSFAVDVISRAGDLPSEAGPAFFVVAGAAGFVGLATGDAISRIGVRRVLTTCFVAFGGTGLLLAAFPASWAGVAVAAALLGIAIMGSSALLSAWSSLLFPDKPSTGFSATLVFLGLGSIVGPIGLGTLAGSSSLATASAVAGGLGVLAGVVSGVVVAPTGRS